MTWPMSQDFNEAIQVGSNFADDQLRVGEVQTNAIGLPMARSGNFADVYRVDCPDGTSWAIKCFTREVPGLADRYAAIDRHLSSNRLPFTVGFQFLREGVRVRGKWYPLLKMEWVEGMTLNEFAREQRTSPGPLEALAGIWTKMAARLRNANVAHADLQHGNVLLVRGEKAKSLGVRLVDYDGMWVPELQGKVSGELGHPAYQHPRRLRGGEEGYGPDVDRFPHLVIYSALRACRLGDPEWWDRFDTGDNLMFRKDDFLNPQDSALLRALWRHPSEELQTLAGYLALASKTAPARVPWVDQLIESGTLRGLNANLRQKAAEILGEAAPTAVPISAPAPIQASPWADIDADDQADTLDGHDEYSDLATMTDSQTGSYRRKRASQRGSQGGGMIAVLAGAAFLLVGVVVAAIIVMGGESPETDPPAIAENPTPDASRERPTPINENQATPLPEQNPSDTGPTVPAQDPRMNPMPGTTPGIPAPPPARPHFLSGALSHDGKFTLGLVATSGNERHVMVFDKTRLEPLHDISKEVNPGPIAFGGYYPHPTQNLVFYRDNQLDKLIVWNLEAGEIEQEYPLPEDAQGDWNELVVSPNGRFLSGTYLDKERTIVFDIERAEWLGVIAHRIDDTPMQDVKVRPSPVDGSLLVSCLDNQVRWFRPDEPVREFPLSSDRVVFAEFLADGKRFVSADSRWVLRVTDLESGETIHSANLEARVQMISVSAIPKPILVSTSKSVQLYDPDNWEKVDTVLVREGHFRGKLSGDGRHAVIYGSNLVSHFDVSKIGDGSATVGASDAMQPKPWGEPLDVSEGVLIDAGMTPDGALVAALDSRLSHASVFDGKTGEQLYKIHERLELQPQRVLPFAVDQTRGRVYFSLVSRRQVLLVWDMKSAELLEEIAIPPDQSWAGIQISSNGRYLAGTFSSQQGRGAQVRDLVEEEWLPPINYDYQGSVLLKFVPSPQDGSLLLPDADGVIKFFRQGEEPKKFSGHEGKLFSVCFAPDGSKFFSSGEDKTIRLWDIATGNQLWSIDVEDTGRNLVSTPDGRHLLACFPDKAVKAFDTRDGTEAYQFPDRFRFVSNIALSGDGSKALIFRTQPTRIWEMPTSNQVVAGSPDPMPTPMTEPMPQQAGVRVGKPTLRHQLTGMTDEILSLDFSANGELVAAVSKDKRLIVYNVATGEAVHELDELAQAPYRIAAVLFRGNNHLLMASDQGRVYLYDLETKKSLFDIAIPGSGSRFTTLSCMAMSPNGQEILVGGIDRPGMLVSLNSRKVIAQYPASTRGSRCVAFSPNGQLILVGGRDDHIRIYTRQGKLAREFDTGSTSRSCLAADFSPDGNLVAGGFNQSTRLWDLATQKQIARFSTGNFMYNFDFQDVAFTPDGNHLITMTRNQGMYVLNAHTGESLHGSITNDPNNRNARMALSPDGSHVVLGTTFGDLSLWTIPKEGANEANEEP